MQSRRWLAIWLSVMTVAAPLAAGEGQGEFAESETAAPADEDGSEQNPSDAAGTEETAPEGDAALSTEPPEETEPEGPEDASGGAEDAESSEPAAASLQATIVEASAEAGTDFSAEEIRLLVEEAASDAPENTDVQLDCRPVVAVNWPAYRRDVIETHDHTVDLQAILHHIFEPAELDLDLPVHVTVAWVEDYVHWEPLEARLVVVGLSIGLPYVEAGVGQLQLECGQLDADLGVETLVCSGDENCWWALNPLAGPPPDGWEIRLHSLQATVSTETCGLPTAWEDTRGTLISPMEIAQRVQAAIESAEVNDLLLAATCGVLPPPVDPPVSVPPVDPEPEPQPEPEEEPQAAPPAAPVSEESLDDVGIRAATPPASAGAAWPVALALLMAALAGVVLARHRWTKR